MAPGGGGGNSADPPSRGGKHRLPEMIDDKRCIVRLRKKLATGAF
jgi:hypothetical protein